MVKPTLLYGCEIWGLGNIEIIERVHIKFCKLLLQLKNSTPTYMIYGELGRYPIVLDVKIRILSFWSKLLLGKESKLSLIIYRLCFEMYTVKDANLPWLKNVHNIINECGLAYIWNTQTSIYSNGFISLGADHLTCRCVCVGRGVCFFFRSDICFRITQELEY